MEDDPKPGSASTTKDVSSEINDAPPAVLESVTRRIREAKVGSVKIEFAGPKTGGGDGMGFGSVPV
jgi:hypothetical protein